jgi:hypothetical protein
VGLGGAGTRTHFFGEPLFDFECRIFALYLRLAASVLTGIGRELLAEVLMESHTISYADHV